MPALESRAVSSCGAASGHRITLERLWADDGLLPKAQRRRKTCRAEPMS